jgi:transposase-like protein
MEGISMAPVHHGRTATRACRAAVQRTQALFAQLSQDLGLNPNTLSNWRKRATVDDNKTGPTSLEEMARAVSNAHIRLSSPPDGNR